MTDGERLVVVGASVAATAFLERLRELEYRGFITVIDPDPDAPYDRPPLSKQFLVDSGAALIEADWAELDAQIIRGWAVDVDPNAGTLAVDSSEGAGVETVRFDRLVVACGATPAHLPVEPAGVPALRSAEDARRLRAHAATARTATIIGAGAIGVELASSFAARGLAVTLIDRAAGPLERLLAGHLMDAATEWLQEAGVTCKWSADIQRIEKTDGGWEVELGDGQLLASDLLVSAVGARPAVGWLGGSGLLSDGALLTDDLGRVQIEGQTIPGVYAIGDAASRRDTEGRVSRTESWTAAREQGTRLAEHLCGQTPQPFTKPYFWTEVAGRKVQVAGELVRDGSLELEHDNPARKSLLYRIDGPDGRQGWIGINAQPRIARLLMS